MWGEEYIVSGVSYKKSQLVRTSFELGGLLPFKALPPLSRKIITDLIAALEVAIVIFCAAIAKFLYVDQIVQTGESIWLYVGIGSVGATFSYIALKKQGLYQSDKIIEMRGHVPRIFFALAGAFLILIAVAYFFKIAHVYSRGWLLIWFTLSLFMISVQRKLVTHMLQKLAKKGRFSHTIAIFGSGSIGQKLVKYFTQDDIDIRLAGIFGDKAISTDHTASKSSISGDLKGLIKLAREKHIDKIIIALPPSQEKKILEVRKALEVLPIDIHLCPNLINLNLRCPSVSNIGDVNLLDIHRKPIKDWEHFTKRAFDFAGASLLLLVLSPIMALIALGIKLDSSGSILFSQRRHGFNRKIIDVLKFRSMSVTEDGAYALQATKNDMRITRIGKFLRRTSLDELPQLWNVIKGEMSLVGPRPHPLKLDKDFEELEHYAHRNKVKPGITGWAQVHGYRGETDTPEKMQNRVKYDLDYINNWSIWLDITILARTVAVVVKGDSAY